MSAATGVSVAFDAELFDSDPTWTDLADTPNLVAGYTVQRGRSDLFEQVGAGSASVAITDTDGLFDSTNATSPYAGTGWLDRKQCAIALHHPITDEWGTIFCGQVENYPLDLDPTEQFGAVSLEAVDALDYLGRFQLTSRTTFGSPPLFPIKADVWYPPTSSTAKERIDAVLDQSLWPSSLDWRTVFTANVKLQASSYTAQQTVMDVIDEACEAEFPGIANRFIARDGQFVFHGRLARFNPGLPEYGINFWYLGDGAATMADPNKVQMRGLTWNRGPIINTATCTPKGVKQVDRSACTFVDDDSVARNGTLAWNAEDLIIQNSVLTGNNGLDECRLYALYYIAVFAIPTPNVTQITVRSMNPADPRAEAVWDFLTGVELSDIVRLTTTHPGGGGFDGTIASDFFVEGLTYTVNPIGPSYQDVELVLDVTPRSQYDFEWVPE